jgi:hypothetical protein
MKHSSEWKEIVLGICKNFVNFFTIKIALTNMKCGKSIKNYIHKKSRADRIQGVLATIQFRISYLSISYLKNVETKIYRTISLPVLLYGGENWFLTVWEHRLRVYGLLKRILDLRERK